MKITIVYPARTHSAYKIAAETFASLAWAVAGAEARCVCDEEYTRSEGDGEYTVLIGNDAVNSVCAELYLSGKVDGFGIRYCTDDYCIRSVDCDKQTLILAGGRPRSTIYAVYRYFEVFCGCRWFWDGDRITKKELVFSGIDLVESPRFEYRGLRYFAHRSLHRFQAEHWSFEDFCTEIDWMLKKRLNLFMLRIGMDDLFQKAFPDTVSYPNRDEKLPEAGEGYDDRTLFWSLEYRGELRKRILAYAFERDLMHPEDCGTMTHWYSRTPCEFLEKVKPTMLPQANEPYNDPTGRVWDIRDRDNFDNYFKLTKTHITEYGKGEIFHTIGLGERLYSADPEKNKRMKLYVYRKIAMRLKEEYPNAPLLIASWDLWMHFTPEEVRALVCELDPAQSLVLDYTSDTTRKNNFTSWGVQNEFPWIFGIFGGYEPNSEIRGFYELTNERLKLAKADPMCRGVVLWPELSHGDPFAIEYFANNAWESDTLSIAEQTDRYCTDRYPTELAPSMCELWRDLMPIICLTAWSVDDSYLQNGNDIFPRIIRRAQFDREKAQSYKEKVAAAAECKPSAARVLAKAAELYTSDELTRRDMYDIARTVIGRYINAAILKAEHLYVTDASASDVLRVTDIAEGLMETLSDLLSSHEDYSLCDSLSRLQSVTETNPHFEEILKNNAESGYCRGYIYENAQYLYLPEMRLLFGELRYALAEGRAIDRDSLAAENEKIRERYFATPLHKMKKADIPYREVVLRAAELIESLEL